MTVQREEYIEVEQADMFLVYGISDQVYPNGKTITPIALKYDSANKDEVTISVEGLPPGVVHSEKELITGAPAINDWLPTEKNRIFNVLVRFTKGDSELTQDFTFTVFQDASQLAEAGDSGEHAPPEGDKETPPPEGDKEIPPPEGDKETPPPEGDKDKTPSEGDKEIPPPEGDKDKTPSEGDKDKTPSEGDKDKTPSEGDKDKTPSDGSTGIPGDIPELDPEDFGKVIIPPPPPPRGGLTIGIAAYKQDEALGKQLQGIAMGLQQMGYVPGSNITIKYLNAEGQHDMALQNAKDLADDQLALIIAIGQPMAGIMRAALTNSTPLIFLNVPDPVAEGLSQDNRLGMGPVTGFSSLIAPERLFQEALGLKPNALWYGLLHGPRTDGQRFVRAVEGMSLGAHVSAIDDPAQLLEKGKLLLQTSDVLLLNLAAGTPDEIRQLGEAALLEKKVLIGIQAEQVEQGAALALVPDPARMGTRCGLLAARILNGSDASAIPYEDAEDILCLFSPEAADHLGLQLPLGAEPVF
ncbi:MAG: hypothetical protein GXZ04_05565 [Clostridiales bacterium]|nr:hypothetical protein [Clostridiales bacterium]